MRQSPNSVQPSWIYVGSHNFSPSAWGRMQIRDKKFYIANYELGVLLLPGGTRLQVVTIIISNAVCQMVWIYQPDFLSYSLRRVTIQKIFHGLILHFNILLINTMNIMNNIESSNDEVVMLQEITSLA